MGGSIGDAKVFHHAIDGQCRSGSTGVCTDRVSRRKLKAAILESLTTKARTVWILDRRTLNVEDPLDKQPCCETGGRNPDLRMRPVKRRGLGHYNPAGARASGARWLSQSRRPHIEAGYRRAATTAEGGSKRRQRMGYVGSDLSRRWLRKAPC